MNSIALPLGSRMVPRARSVIVLRLSRRGHRRILETAAQVGGPGSLERIRRDRAFNRQEHLCPPPQSQDWFALHFWYFWVSRPCPRSRRVRAPTPSRDNEHSTTHAGPATRPRKATIAWVRTSTISSEGKPVRSRTTANPAP